MAELAVSKQATFLWEGKDKKGNRVKGRGLARDEMEIRSDLRKQGIAATKVRKESKGRRVLKAHRPNRVVKAMTVSVASKASRGSKGSRGSRASEAKAASPETKAAFRP